MNKLAKYTVGQTILHVKQQYRGLIVDVDEHFLTQQGLPLLKQGNGQKINEPWYRILVDESEVITYVRESLLEKDFDPSPVQNPKISDYLTERKDGTYKPSSGIN